MENQGDENRVDMEIDEIPDEFQCCVCLELLYKPVVIGCGHIACFWCVYKFMNFHMDSSCPVCRHQFHHFPRICGMMHFLLLKLYPLSYKRREIQVAEEEKKTGFMSPQLDDDTSEACSQELVVKGPTLPLSLGGLGRSSSRKGEASLLHDLSENTGGGNKTENTKGGDKFIEQNDKHWLLAYLKCGVCKLLLCCPVVLNCGHVYCGACIFNQCDKLCRCPVCQTEHPNGYPRTCLVIEHFITEQFPEEHAARKRTYLHKSDSESTSGTKMIKNVQSSSAHARDIRSCLPGEKPVHHSVGCDYCGMTPIIGERYKCKDCKEKMGFDLCGECYRNSSSNLRPGRFNQQHTADHKFNLMQPLQFINGSLGTGSPPYDPTGESYPSSPPYEMSSPGGPYPYDSTGDFYPASPPYTPPLDHYPSPVPSLPYTPPLDHYPSPPPSPPYEMSSPGGPHPYDSTGEYYPASPPYTPTVDHFPSPPPSPPYEMSSPGGPHPYDSTGEYYPSSPTYSPMGGHYPSPPSL
ncbi:unnamed protein product [Cuscuta epithymum]|uniref:E3 ubiquitin-protein ligase PRT1 n=1 Tax=Cuscuta epithymum TaxID=186058 RepID=A0AAV0CT90_9ASTE|nr:unnamed protein product [Cuscuta epithymum]